MKKIMFIVEKTNTGYSAYPENENLAVYTTGRDIKELRANLKDALDTWTEHERKPKIKAENIITRINLEQFFEFYRILNFSALGERIGMNSTLMSQYANGVKHPSDKQVSRILTGVRELGRELAAIDIV